MLYREDENAAAELAMRVQEYQRARREIKRWKLSPRDEATGSASPRLARASVTTGSVSADGGGEDGAGIAVVEIADAIGEKGGVYGCRMTGGGFGGYCVALVKASAVDAITKKITADYKARTGIAATIFSSRPAAGAMVLKR